MYVHTYISTGITQYLWNAMISFTDGVFRSSRGMQRDSDHKRPHRRWYLDAVHLLSTTVMVLALLQLQAQPALSFKSISLESSRKQTISSKPTALQLSPLEIAAGLGVAFGGWLYVDGADDRARKRMREEENARYDAYQAERAQKAYIEPRDTWTVAELAEYDGTRDEDGPILFAADGLVFNVWKGRNFYGPGGEYHIFAGRDATRLLARTRVEEETEEEASKPLTMAERAALAGWMFTFKGKYDIVGKLEGFDATTTKM